MARERTPAKRSGALLVLITLVAVLSISAVALAVQGVLTSAEESAAPPAPPILTTEVVVRPVSQRIDGEVSIVPGFSRDLNVVQPTSGEPIYTRAGLSAGSSAGQGAVLAVVAERPVFALRGTVPVYRALGPGAVGSDVAQLQANLREMGATIEDRDGEYKAGTAIAVFRFYERIKFAPVDAAGSPLTGSQPSSAGVPYGEMRFLPELPVVAKTPCGEQGSSAEDVMCTVEGGVPAMQIAVPTVDGASVAPGMPVEVQFSDGTSATATIGALVADLLAPQTDTQPNEEGGTQRPAATTVTFALTLPEGTLTAFDQEGSGSIVVASSESDALSVESVAVRSNSENKTWLVTTDGEIIDVELGICSGGFCEVAGSDLTDGLEIQLTENSGQSTEQR